jgi:hypothetical protein
VRIAGRIFINSIGAVLRWWTHVGSMWATTSNQGVVPSLTSAAMLAVFVAVGMQAIKCE